MEALRAQLVSLQADLAGFRAAAGAFMGGSGFCGEDGEVGQNLRILSLYNIVFFGGF